MADPGFERKARARCQVRPVAGEHLLVLAQPSPVELELAAGEGGGVGAEEELQDSRVTELAQLLRKRPGPVLSAPQPFSVSE